MQLKREATNSSERYVNLLDIDDKWAKFYEETNNIPVM